MKVHHYTYDKDDIQSTDLYGQFESWDEDYMPPHEILPKLGAYVTNGKGNPIVFMAVDMSNNVSRAFLNCLQTKPGVPPLKRYRAVKMAEAFLMERLKDHGYTHIWAATPHAKLACLAQDLGYHVGETPAIILQKEIT